MGRVTTEESEGLVKNLAGALKSLRNDNEKKLLLIGGGFLEDQYKLICQTHKGWKKEDIDNLFIEKVLLCNNDYYPAYSKKIPFIFFIGVFCEGYIVGEDRRRSFELQKSCIKLAYEFFVKKDIKYSKDKTCYETNEGESASVEVRELIFHSIRQIFSLIAYYKDITSISNEEKLEVLEQMILIVQHIYGEEHLNDAINNYFYIEGIQDLSDEYDCHHTLGEVDYYDPPPKKTNLLECIVTEYIVRCHLFEKDIKDVIELLIKYGADFGIFNFDLLENFASEREKLGYKNGYALTAEEKGYYVARNVLLTLCSQGVMGIRTMSADDTIKTIYSLLTDLPSFNIEDLLDSKEKFLSLCYAGSHYNISHIDVYRERGYGDIFTTLTDIFLDFSNYKIEDKYTSEADESRKHIDLTILYFFRKIEQLYLENKDDELFVDSYQIIMGRVIYTVYKRMGWMFKAMNDDSEWDFAESYAYKKAINLLSILNAITGRIPDSNFMRLNLLFECDEELKLKNMEALKANGSLFFVGRMQELANSIVHGFSECSDKYNYITEDLTIHPTDLECFFIALSTSRDVAEIRNFSKLFTERLSKSLRNYVMNNEEGVVVRAYSDEDISKIISSYMVIEERAVERVESLIRRRKVISILKHLWKSDTDNKVRTGVSEEGSLFLIEIEELILSMGGTLDSERDKVKTATVEHPVHGAGASAMSDDEEGGEKEVKAGVYTPSARAVLPVAEEDSVTLPVPASKHSLEPGSR